MKFYADLPARRSRQILADVLMLGWALLWVLVARGVHAATLTLAAPGRALESAGGSFRDGMTGAGDRVSGLPLIEDRLAAPFRSVAGVGTEISGAGTDLIEAVERLALISALTTAIIPISIVGALWFFLRYRWVRQATAAARFIDSRSDLDLFALRAMANQPMTRLARISADPAGAWRRGDAEVITALAGLELADSGLRPPPQRPVVGRD
ncbi:MAG: hypothetical protein Q4G67_06030 [Actinomycetia bacterium]|nr:hypothetical protein [Actinomycetes bacterium]